MPLPLKTERLVIRSYREDDATPLHEVFGSPDVMKWTPSPGKGPEVEVAYELAPRVWGHGYATEAARALVDYGFGELSLRRIVALILPDNARSRNVASKCGLILEGPGRFYGLDLVVYAREWPVG